MYIRYDDEVYNETFEVNPFEDGEEEEFYNIVQMYRENNLKIEEISFRNSSYTKEEIENEVMEFIKYFLENEKGVLELKDVQMSIWESSYNGMKELKSQGINLSNEFFYEAIEEDFDTLNFASEEQLNDPLFLREMLFDRTFLFFILS